MNDGVRITAGPVPWARTLAEGFPAPVEEPPASADPIDVGRLAVDLRLACQRIARRIRFESAPHDTPPHQLSVLFQVESGPRTPGELAAREKVSAPSMTRTINGLADQGYVAREPHPQDGRQVLVRLTDAGAGIIAQARASRDAWMANHLDGLSAEDLRLLARAARLLAEAAR